MFGVPLHGWILCPLQHGKQPIISQKQQNLIESSPFDRFAVFQVCNGAADCQGPTDPHAGPTDEQGCRSWTSWGHWSSCSASCGSGSRSRQRFCGLGHPLFHCAGEAVEKQECFNTTCPGKTGVLPMSKSSVPNASLFCTSGWSLAVMGELVQLFQLWGRPGQTQRLRPSSLRRQRLFRAPRTLQPPHGNK